MHKNKGKILISQEKINKIIELYTIDKKSMIEIENILNICRATITKILGANNIFKRDWRKKYKINENYFNQIDTFEKAYILGLLYADGNTYRYSVKIALQDRDKDILEKINILIGSNKPLIFQPKQKENWKDQYILYMSNKQIVNDLIKCGVVPNKTFKITFPDFLSDDLIPHFIRGYFDGDGCLYINKNNLATWEIIGTNSLCNSIKEKLINNLNMKSTINEYKSSVGISRLRVSAKNDIYKIYEYLYKNSTIHLERKYNKFQEFFEKRKIVKLPGKHNK